MCDTRAFFLLNHPVHTYPYIFESATFSFRILKCFHPHVAYSNRICPSTRIRNVSGFTLVLRTLQGNRGNRTCAMKPSAAVSAAILRIDFTVRNWARSCYVIPIKKYPDLVSTRFRIHSGLKNIHSGDRIQKVADSPENSPDTRGRKA